MVKQLTEAALAAELDTYLANNSSKNNRRNGYAKKTMKSASGRFELEITRDSADDFEPQLVKKNQIKLTEETDSKIISLYSYGMSYRDIKTHIAEMYGMELSDGAITNIIDQLVPQLKAWQQRPLEAICSFVWLDAIHYKIKEEGRYVSKAVSMMTFTALGNFIC